MSKKQCPIVGLDPNLPYSPIIQVGDFFYSAGVLPDVVDGKPVSGSIGQQTREVLGRIEKMLHDCGLSYNDLFKVTILISGSMAAYQEINKIYSDFLRDVEIMPARKTLAVAGLPFGVLIEIEFEAIKQREEKEI